MKPLLALLLLSTAARADKVWIVDPGQTLVSAELSRFSATSVALNGRVEELDSGAIRAELHLPLASFFTGHAQVDQRVRREADARQFPEVVFEAEAPPAGRDGMLHLTGTLTFHGVTRSLEVPAQLVRAGRMTFGHALLSVHLRDFGIAVPAALSDELRVEVDAGFRPDNTVAAR